MFDLSAIVPVIFARVSSMDEFHCLSFNEGVIVRTNDNLVFYVVLSSAEDGEAELSFVYFYGPFSELQNGRVSQLSLSLEGFALVNDNLSSYRIAELANSKALCISASYHMISFSISEFDAYFLTFMDEIRRETARLNLFNSPNHNLILHEDPEIYVPGSEVASTQLNQAERLLLENLGVLNMRPRL